MEGYYNLKGRNLKRGLRDPDDPRYAFAKTIIDHPITDY